jgi:hypothetical protein
MWHYPMCCYYPIVALLSYPHSSHLPFRFSLEEKQIAFKL